MGPSFYDVLVDRVGVWPIVDANEEGLGIKLKREDGNVTKHSFLQYLAFCHSE